eukprot:352821-Chlamydomonas_euryale.AAC.5
METYLIRPVLSKLRFVTVAATQTCKVEEHRSHCTRDSATEPLIQQHLRAYNEARQIQAASLEAHLGVDHVPDARARRHGRNLGLRSASLLCACRSQHANDWWKGQGLHL